MTRSVRSSDTAPHPGLQADIREKGGESSLPLLRDGLPMYPNLNKRNFEGAALEELVPEFKIGEIPVQLNLRVNIDDVDDY